MVKFKSYPNTIAPATTEYSINGLAGPWSDKPYDYTNLAIGDYDVWARDAALAPNFVYEQLQTSVISQTLFLLILKLHLIIMALM